MRSFVEGADSMWSRLVPELDAFAAFLEAISDADDALPR